MRPIFSSSPLGFVICSPEEPSIFFIDPAFHFIDKSFVFASIEFLDSLINLIISSIFDKATANPSKI